MKFIDTSLEAHEAIKPSKEALYQQILSYIRLQGYLGATCDEIEEALGLRHQTASARCAELLASGRVYRDGKRKTRSGRQAHVLKILKHEDLSSVSSFFDQI